jgi:hypothetical protein
LDDKGANSHSIVKNKLCEVAAFPNFFISPAGLSTLKLEYDQTWETASRSNY